MQAGMTSQQKIKGWNEQVQYPSTLKGTKLGALKTEMRAPPKSKLGSEPIDVSGVDTTEHPIFKNKDAHQGITEMKKSEKMKRD
jgi:hypothetical protein